MSLRNQKTGNSGWRPLGRWKDVYSKLGGWISGGSIGFGHILYTCLVLYKRDGFFWGSLNPDIIPYAHIHNHIYTYVHIYTVLHTRINKHVHIIGLHTSLGEYLYFHVSCSLLAARCYTYMPTHWQSPFSPSEPQHVNRQSSTLTTELSHVI